MQPNKNAQAGSIFVYILAGVILFAALAFSLSQNRGTNISLMDKGSARAAASQIIDFSNAVADATDKMILAHISETAISFKNPVSTLNYTNPNCSTDSCKVFAPGGKLVYRKPDPSAFIPTPPVAGWLPIYKDWFITAAACVANAGTGTWTCGGSTGDQYDLIIQLPFLKKEVCDAINKALGTPLTMTDVGASIDTLPLVPYVGVIDGNHYGAINLSPPGVNGLVTSGCYASTDVRPPDGTYTFFKVLLAR